MSQAWYDNAIAPDGRPEDGCRPEEAQALKLYLDGQIDVAETARLMTEPTESSKVPGENLPNLWALMQDTLLGLPGVVCPISNTQDLPKFEINIHGKKQSDPLQSPSGSFRRDLLSFANRWYDGTWWYYQNEWRQKPHFYPSPDKVAEIDNLARAEAVFAHTDFLGDRVKYKGFSRL